MTIRINHYFTSIFSNSLFNHPKRFSIGLRSGLWEGQGIWFGRFSSRNFLTTLDLCFGSLSMTTRQAFSWKTNAWDIKWVCKIHKNISEFILWLKIHNGNVPIEENAAHTLILGVCFTVGTSLFLPDLVHIFKLPRLSQSRHFIQEYRYETTLSLDKHAFKLGPKQFEIGSNLLYANKSEGNHFYPCGLSLRNNQLVLHFQQ